MLNNILLMAPVTAWFVAQLIKTIIYIAFNKTFVAERLVGGGGMPSSHSATVCALSTITLLKFGVNSFEFAITCVFALVTMYDAMGVRRETGRQGEVINDMVETFKNMGKDIGPDKALKELIGHSPLQVAVGAVLGILIAVFMYNMEYFI
ncbi:MAG: divergent PAP2 family protein [Lachnospiraceae bacterium]|nr:divergent PAP2 family protein [Lachnospiraceae bacterium]